MPSLDPVTQRFLADVRPYLDAMESLIEATELATAAVEELQAKIDALDGKVVTIAVKTVGSTDVGDTGGLAETVAQVHDLGIAWTEEAAKQAAADAAAEAFGRDVARTAADVEDLRIRIEDAIAAQGDFEYGMMQAYGTNAELNRSIIESKDNMWAYAETVQKLGPAFLVSKDAIDQTAGAVDNANRGWAVQIGWFRLTATALHWIVAGSAEFLAVAVPAAIALGAGMAVAAQGAQNAYTHFSALYAATESTSNAMHKTVGDVLGVGNALQTAQNAANPGVYEILGSALNDAKSGFSSLATVGLQVVHMFDEFAARVTVDLQSGLGTEVQGLLSGMVKDLEQFGQILGNLGHALLNFAAAMPGLVHVLLDLAVALSEVIEWASRGGQFLTFAIAMEEVFRWGGLLLNLFARLGGVFTGLGGLASEFAGGGGFLMQFAGAFRAIIVEAGTGIAVLGHWISELPVFAAATDAAGAAMEEFGTDVAIAGTEMSNNWVIAAVAAAAALTILAYKLITMKTATEEWIAASSEAVSKASDLTVLPTIYNQLADTLTRASAAQRQFSDDSQHLSQNEVFAGRSGEIMSDSMRNSGTSAVQLSQHMVSLLATADTVRGNINLLAGVFHTSAVGALALANAAGINLQVGLTKGSTAAKIAEMQITNLKTGLGAMQAPASEIGADMEAVGVQSALASSKVSQVNQALDAFIAGTTGGMNEVMQFNAQLRQMGKDGLSTSVSITGAVNSIARDAAKMGYTLQGIGPKAQQSWQQFDAAVQQGNSVLDTFRTGMAEGVVTQQQYTNEIKAVGGALLPFAAHNRTALAIVSQLAQEMGDPATTNLRTLASQFGITGRAAQDMATTGMERAIARMANLNTVARNLSVTVGTQLDSAMASAIVKASGLDSAYLKWATAVKSGAGPSTLAADLRAITTDQNFVNTAMAKGTTVLNTHAAAAEGDAGSLAKLATQTGDATSKISAHITALDQAQSASDQMASKVANLSSNLSTNASDTSRAGTAAQQTATQMQHLGSMASTAQGDVGNVNNEIRTMSQLAGPASSQMSQLAGAIQHAGSMAGIAAGQVQQLASEINSLQSKSITITTNMVTTTSTVHRQHGGPVWPGGAFTVGEAGPELFVPHTAGFIVPAPQTQVIASPETAAQIGGGGGRHMTATVPVVVQLDGQKIWQNQQTLTLRYGARNGSQQTGAWAPGRASG